jgi:hypothetical protein
MRINNLLRWAALFMALALTPFVASGQGKNARLSTAKIAGQGLIVSVKGDKRKQVASAAAKKLNVNPAVIDVAPGAIKVVTPDLTISNVFQIEGSSSQKVQHFIVVENKGSVAAGPCTLKFMYGDTLDALQSVDYKVPAIPPGGSANVNFTPPDKNFHWWLFGVDAGNELKEANFSNNIYLIEFKEGPKEPEIK